MEKRSKPEGIKHSLRKRAEELLAGKSENLGELSATDIQDLIHELRVHQIELEVQNEELRGAQVELEESRNKYADLYDFAPVGYFSLNDKGTILEANLTGATLLGVGRTGVIRQNFFWYISVEDHKLFYSYRERLLKDPTRQTCELKMLRGDREPFYSQLEGVAVFNGDGGFSHFRVAVLDITERKRAEDELSRAQNLESLGVLAGGIAHDFNNLLTAILGNISLVKMHADLEDKTQNRLIEAEKACFKVRDLTQQLLTFAKGGAPIKRRVSIAKLIGDSASFALMGSNVKCEFSVPNSPPTGPGQALRQSSGQALWPVEVDEGQIGQVVGNLIINANQAMPEGGIIKVSAENITVGAEHALPIRNGNYVKIFIQDQGVGIQKEHLQKIFDPYFTTKQKGSGLGLSTAYSIIKQHGGHITVESELGVGTTFTVYLPASEKEAPKETGKRERPPVGKGRILIMDDEKNVREVIGNMLSHIGCEFEFAVDGGEAIELYKRARESENPFDAVILDLTVPGGMSGKEAIKGLLQIDPDVKAIVSSGYSNDAVMSEFREHGFRGVVTKPYRVEGLSEALYNVIGGLRELKQKG